MSTNTLVFSQSISNQSSFSKSHGFRNSNSNKISSSFTTISLLFSAQVITLPAAHQGNHHHNHQRQDGYHNLTTTATCVSNTSSSQPNPIAQEYAQEVTGTLNATLAIVPIPLSLARQLVPSKWAILEAAYRALLPDFPQGMYPVVMQAGLDHDIQLAAYDISVADFQRIGWSFPFIDLLGDGYTSFTWAPAQFISADNEIAIAGSQAYGTRVFPAAFDQSCEAYSRQPDGAVGFAAREVPNNNNNTTTGSSVHTSFTFSPLSSSTEEEEEEGGSSTAMPYPLGFFKNVTNQPIFANGSQCDLQVRLFNSTINQGAHAPVPVRGRIYSNLPPLNQSMIDGTAGDSVGSDTAREGVFGILVDTPFIEYNQLDCQTLAGYSGTGSGD